MIQSSGLVSRFLEASRSHPERLAVRMQRRAATYRELELRAGGVARALQAAGQAPVLVLATNGIDLASSALGILSSGNPVVPADPRSGGRHLTDLVRSVGASAVVSSDPGFVEDIGLASDVAIVSPGEAVPGPLCPPPMDEGARALIGFTSGSTGPPKLRADSHASLLHRVTRRQPAAPTEGERLGMLLGATHSAVKRILNVLLLGGTVSCFDARSDTMEQVLEGFAAHRITYLHLVPTYLRKLFEAAQGEAVLPSLRVLATSGEGIDWQDVADFRRIAPSSMIRHTYGATETGRIAERLVRPDEPLGLGTVPVGWPIAEHEVWIEAADGTPAVPGEAGEVVVDGEWFREGIDVEVLSSGRSRYRTGDLGRFDVDGQLVLLGRLDRRLKVGGIRIQPLRIEEVLREAEEVGQVVVLAAAPGGAGAGIIAHLGGASGRPDLEASLRARVEQAVHAAAVPSRFEWYPEGLPTLPNGKVDPKRLRDRSRRFPGA